MTKSSRTAYSRRTVWLGLACNHKLEIMEPAPEIGADQYCIRCGTWKRVDSYLVNYRTTCKAKCTFGRNFGDDEEKAKIAARKHIGSNPRHTVELLRDGKKVAEFNNVEETLFHTLDEVKEIAKEAAAVLNSRFPGTEIIEERERFGF